MRHLASRSVIIPTLVALAVLCAQSFAASQDNSGARSLRRHMREMAEPGQMHAVLESLEGNWTVRARLRMTPEANPERASGRATYRWLLDKRFLEQQLTLRTAGREIEARGLLGYDNYRSAYSGIWVNNNDSGVTLVSGRLDETGTVLELSVTGNDPRFDEPQTRTARLEIVDNDTHTWKVFEPHPETGEAVVMVDFIYERSSD